MPSWEECLSQAGCRITGSRRAVIRVLENASSPLSPQEILGEAEERGHSLGLVTVYRTLGVLMELGLVRRVHLTEGCHGYLSASPGHTHVIVCQRCGHAVEFSGGDDLKSLTERVESDTGYRIEDHLLQLEGLCPACRDSGRDDPGPGRERSR